MKLLLDTHVVLWSLNDSERLGLTARSLSDAIDQSGVARLGIKLAHLLALAGLPIPHRDPFDRLLIAQAVAEEATFMSEDQNAPRYPVTTIGCSG